MPRRGSPGRSGLYKDIDTLFDIPASARVELESDEVMDTLAETVREEQPYRVANVVRIQEHETLFQAAMAILNSGRRARPGPALRCSTAGARRTQTRRLRRMRSAPCVFHASAISSERTRS